MENGQVYQDSLDELDVTPDWLLQRLKEEGYPDVEDVLCAEWHKDRLWVYPR